MANAGAHSNASQFFITLAPLPWLDCKAVAFGRVIKGLPALRVFNRLETRNERPVDSITIGGCGEVGRGRPRDRRRAWRLHSSRGKDARSLRAPRTPSVP